MRKADARRAFLMLVLAVFLATGCATLTGRTAGQTIDDSTITTKINGKIIQDPQLSYLKLDVDTFQGAVTLSGTVPSKAAQDRLVEIVKSTEGVKSVKTNLVIQPPQ
ncbi:MAG: BON domain-containing protein [Nitrospirota bacterium]